MTADTYQLQPADSLLLHGSSAPQLLRDHSDNAEHMEIEALVASGDCLVTLATVLDDTTQHLKDDPKIAQTQTESVIRTLLYLQRRYKLTRKPSEHRQ